MKKINETIKRIYNRLKEENFFYEVYYDFSNEEFIIEVEWGDWRHDHLRIDYIMAELGFTKIDVVTTEEDGSDCYSANHIYKESKIIEINELIKTSRTI